MGEADVERSLWYLVMCALAEKEQGDVGARRKEWELLGMGVKTAPLRSVNGS